MTLSPTESSAGLTDVLGPSQVLFCYEQFDELTLLHLREFDKKKLISVETDIVIDHYKEEKFEDGSTGRFFPFSLRTGVGGGLGMQVRPARPGPKASTVCCRASFRQRGFIGVFKCLFKALTKLHGPQGNQKYPSEAQFYLLHLRRKASLVASLCPRPGGTCQKLGIGTMTYQAPQWE